MKRFLRLFTEHSYRKDSPALCAESEKGSALAMALILALAIVILATAGSQLLVTTFNEIKHQEHITAEVDNVARAGLADGISWFRRQASQPVCSGYPPTKFAWADGAFNPAYSTDTARCDTIDASIGLVKEYPLTEDGNVWGRYEVKRQTNTTVAAFDGNAVHDITSQRLFPAARTGQGYIWSIVSTGYVYQRKSADADYNEAPNRVIAGSRVSTEIRKISLQLPAECAYMVYNCGARTSRTVRINENGRLNGVSHYAVGYYTYPTGSTNAPTTTRPPYSTSGSGTVDGIPSTFIKLSTAPTVNYVIGVSTADLKLMSDYLVTSVSSLPTTLPDMSLIYIDGDATFTSAHPLQASGILYVNGDLTINAGSHCLYSGLIYVTGTATINDPALISGCVIAYEGLTLSRSGASDVAEIDYDSAILDMVRQQVCQYREIKSAYRIFTGLVNY